MDRKTLRSLIQGTIVTTPTPMDKDLKIDLAMTTYITRWWVSQGLGTNVAPLKVVAAGGEGPDLSDDEWPQVVRTTVNAAGKNAVVMCALKTKNTLHTIDDAKRAADLGAIGLQIDLPFFHHPNQDDYIRYFSDISDKIDIGIMIYNTYWFGAEPIAPETVVKLANNAEHVVAIKWGVPKGADYDVMRQFSDKVNVIDNTSQAVRCHKNGGRGYISSTATAYAKHDLDVWRLMEQKKYAEADAEFDRVRVPLKEWRAKASKSGGYRHIKAYMTAVGKHVGDPRPPTLPMSDDEIAELKQLMRQIGWIK
ncbi:MAG: dihydrodipicolinate synthase family protein [SAR202 cluster bacterium]|nr:dihydrodipicolinate synthase family protein [SAR202 cluster bacterium]